jgi:Tfp pilus assembly protein PilV
MKFNIIFNEGGTTLLEVLISFSILVSVCVFTGSWIIKRTLNNNVSNRLYAVNLAHNYLERTIFSNDYVDKTEQVGLWTIKQSVSGSDQKKVINIQVFREKNPQTQASLYTIRLSDPQKDLPL